MLVTKSHFSSILDYKYRDFFRVCVKFFLGISIVSNMRKGESSTLQYTTSIYTFIGKNNFYSLFDKNLILFQNEEWLCSYSVRASRILFIPINDIWAVLSKSKMPYRHIGTWTMMSGFEMRICCRVFCSSIMEMVRESKVR